jgi:hypothetical protein
MSKYIVKSKKVDCKEVKNKLFDVCEQFGAEGTLPTELTTHLSGCNDCAIFYEHVMKAGFHQLEQEKQTALNPYFINKTLLKTTQQNSTVFEKIVFFKTPVYVTSVLVAGILTGVLLTNLTPTETDTEVEQSIKTNDTNANADANTSTDNSTLTLNDW